MENMSCEAKKLGLVPPEGATEEEINQFRNSVNPDFMGFDGSEVPADLSQFED